MSISLSSQTLNCTDRIQARPRLHAGPAQVDDIYPAFRDFRPNYKTRMLDREANYVLVKIGQGHATNVDEDYYTRTDAAEVAALRKLTATGHWSGLSVARESA